MILSFLAANEMLSNSIDARTAASGGLTAAAVYQTGAISINQPSDSSFQAAAESSVETHSFYNDATSLCARKTLCNLNKEESLHKRLFCYPKGGVQQLTVHIFETEPGDYDNNPHSYVTCLCLVSVQLHAKS